MKPEFIPEEVIIILQVDLIERYGGSYGIRDKGLLDSALSQPKAMFGGHYLHKTIFDKAAAYGYHLCQNHPFIDGNKRIALVAMDTFLQMNGYELKADEHSTYRMIISIAEGKIDKKSLANWLKENSCYS